MSTNATFGTALVGQVETAFGAILDRELSGTGLSAPQWIVLTVALAGGGSADRARLVRQVAGARKVSESGVEASIGELASQGLLSANAEERVTVTDDGRRLHGEIRTAVAEITQRLWGDLAAEELATAARVLSTVLARANQELSNA